MSKVLRLPPIQNVGANQTAILPQVPHGMTYDALVLKLGGTFTKAQITGIRGRINGKLFMDATGTHIDEQNKNKKRVADAAYLAIHFNEPNARTITGEQIGSIDTSSGVDTFDFEFDIGAATSPTLEAYAIISPPKPVMINGLANPHKRTISALLKKAHSFAGAADNAVTLPMGSKLGGAIRRTFFHHTGNVTAVEVRKDGTYLQQTGTVALMEFIQGELNRTAQTNLAVFDPCFTDNQSDAVATLRNDGSPASFEFTVVTSGVDTVTSYTEMYSTIARL